MTTPPVSGLSCRTSHPRRVELRATVTAHARRRQRACNGALAPPKVPLKPLGLDSAFHEANDGDHHFSGHAADESVNSDGRKGAFNPAVLTTYRALVLDSAYRPVRVVSWQRAICLEWVGKVDVLEYYGGMAVRSAWQTFSIPSVVRVRNYVQKYKASARVGVSRNNVLLRDGHTCQYCGSREALTVDHILPVSKGGDFVWRNVVTACQRCNQAKGSKSLAQVGWMPRRQPWEPSPIEMLGLKLAPILSERNAHCYPEVWRSYIVPWQRSSARDRDGGAAAA